MIDAVGEDESTHQHIPQRYLVVPPSNLLPELVVFLRYHLDRDEYAKLIVFFPAARLVEFYADVFSRVGFDLLEIHSRKSQSHRTKVSEKFRTASRAILFTSDVSARGMDYPDVTAVCQVRMQDGCKRARELVNKATWSCRWVCLRIENNTCIGLGGQDARALRGRVCFCCATSSKDFCDQFPTCLWRRRLPQMKLQSPKSLPIPATPFDVLAPSWLEQHIR